MLINAWQETSKGVDMKASLKSLITRTFILALLLFSKVIYADIDNCCRDFYFSLFDSYRQQLSKPDSNTAQFFNLKYLTEGMEKVDIPKSEFRERLINYISKIDELQSKIYLIEGNASCMGRYARIIFRIIDSDSLHRGSFILIRFIDKKITNVSFETSEKLIDGRKIQDLDYTSLTK